MRVSAGSLVREIALYSVAAVCALSAFAFQSTGAITALLVCNLILGVEPVITAIIAKRVEIFSPRILIPFTYMLYSIGPLVQYEWLPADVRLSYMALFVLGMFALRFGLLIGAPLKGGSRQDPLSKAGWDISSRHFFIAAVLLFALSIPSILTHLRAFGGLSGLLSVGYGADRMAVLSSTLRFGPGFLWLLLAGILFVFYGLKQSKRASLIFGTSCVLIASYILIIQGDRSNLIYSFLFGTILFHFGYKPVPRKLILVSFFAGIVLAQTFALSRAFLDKGLVTAIQSGVDVASRRPDLLIPTEYGEFGSPAGSMMELLQYGGPETQYGATYLKAIGTPIPGLSRLFSFYSFDPNLWRMETFHPEVHARGGGKGFSPVTEGYINWGPAGVIFSMFLYGWTIGFAYRKVKTKPSLAVILIFAGALPLFMLEGLRIQAATFLHKLFRSYLAPVLLLFIVRLVLRKKTVKRSSLGGPRATAISPG